MSVLRPVRLPGAPGHPLSHTEYGLTEQAGYGAIVTPSELDECRDLALIPQANGRRTWIEQEFNWGHVYLADNPPVRADIPDSHWKCHYPTPLHKFYSERLHGCTPEGIDAGLRRELWETPNVWGYFHGSPAIIEWLGTPAARLMVPCLRNVWLSFATGLCESPHGDPLQPIGDLTQTTFGMRNSEAFAGSSANGAGGAVHCCLRRETATHTRPPCLVESARVAAFLDALCRAGCSPSRIAITWLEVDGPGMRYSREPNTSAQSRSGNCVSFDLAMHGLRRFQADKIVFGSIPRAAMNTSPRQAALIRRFKVYKNSLRAVFLPRIERVYRDIDEQQNISTAGGKLNISQIQQLKKQLQLLSDNTDFLKGQIVWGMVEGDGTIRAAGQELLEWTKAWGLAADRACADATRGSRVHTAFADHIKALPREIFNRELANREPLLADIYSEMFHIACDVAYLDEMVESLSKNVYGRLSGSVKMPKGNVCQRIADLVGVDIISSHLKSVRYSQQIKGRGIERYKPRQKQ